ncbi:MAG: FHA domain-containing protein [Pseudanabaenaceae cyanobacterium]
MQVSGFHALITKEAGKIILTDQNSKLGCLVNGERVQRAVLKTCDVERVVGAVTALNAVPATAVVAPSPTIVVQAQAETEAPSPAQGEPDFPPLCFRFKTCMLPVCLSLRLPTGRSGRG